MLVRLAAHSDASSPPCARIFTSGGATSYIVPRALLPSAHAGLPYAGRRTLLPPPLLPHVMTMHQSESSDASRECGASLINFRSDLTRGLLPSRVRRPAVAASVLPGGTVSSVTCANRHGAALLPP